jgi:hypothetical protein
MYQAKERKSGLPLTGRAPPINSRGSRRPRLRRGLEDAFSLHYQPIYRLPSREPLALGLHRNVGVDVLAHQLRQSGYAADVIHTVRDHGLEPGRGQA